jgi:DNA segregation ATPase FtsK/SpoIIIE-like protein
MIERMEREGVVSPSEGGRPREVLARRIDDE